MSLLQPAGRNRAGPALRLETHAELDRLGQAWDPLFASGPGVQGSRPWFAASAEAALPDGAQARFVAIEAPDGPVALFPMVAGPGRRWTSLTTPYTCLFQPLIRPGVPAPVLDAAMTAFGRYCREWPITRLEALDPDWPEFAALRAGLAAAGLATRSFEQFGNWHGPITGAAWASYLEARPARLRETIRRRTRAAERAGGMRAEVVSAGTELPKALAAYEEVYARSWKQSEPYPRFNAALIGRLAGSGMLRIGLLWTGGRPIAAQYWTVLGGTATVLKLAHDEDFKAYSPGTVLTAAVIRSLIEHDGVTALDFGRGDDPYKQAWTGLRRVRIGLLALAPWRPAGLLALAAQDGGQLLRRARDCLHLSRALP